jgi:hypothetical protein
MRLIFSKHSDPYNSSADRQCVPTVVDTDRGLAGAASGRPDALTGWSRRTGRFEPIGDFDNEGARGPRPEPTLLSVVRMPLDSTTLRQNHPHRHDSVERPNQMNRVTAVPTETGLRVRLRDLELVRQFRNTKPGSERRRGTPEGRCFEDGPGRLSARRPMTDTSADGS